MVEKYLIFDVKAFFRDYDKHIRQLHQLSAKLDNIGDLSAIDTTKEKVQSSNISSLDNIIIKREPIRKKIKGIQEYVNLVQNILNILTEDEKYIVENFWIDQNGSSTEKRLKVQDYLCIEQAEFYREIDRIVSKVREYMRMS